jgi:hypothetical protein
MAHPDSEIATGEPKCDVRRLWQQTLQRRLLGLGQALDLQANIEAITAWRATLPERQRKRLVHPLSNVRRWRRCGAAGQSGTADLQRNALSAWRRFRACLEAMPPDQAMPMWQTVAAEVATHHIRVYTRKDVGRAVGMDTLPK